MVGFWIYFESTVNRISYGLDIREREKLEEKTVVIQWFRVDYRRNGFRVKSLHAEFNFGDPRLEMSGHQVELLGRQSKNTSLKFRWKGLDWRYK